MEIIGIGVDVVEIARIKKAFARHGERFLERILTQSEQKYCNGLQNPWPSVAGRFAAKEAIAKAFGTGIGKNAGMLDLEIKNDDFGAPFVSLSGAAADYAKGKGISEVKISLSHSRQWAVAQAIALGV